MNDDDPRMSITFMMNPKNIAVRPRSTEPLRRYQKTHPDMLSSDILTNLTESEIDALREAASFKDPKDVPRTTELLNKRVHSWIVRGVPRKKPTGNRVRWSQFLLLLTDEEKATIRPEELELLARESSTLTTREKRTQKLIKDRLRRLHDQSISGKKANAPTP